MAKKSTKTEFDGRIWPNILDFNVNLDSQLTSKANFLFGAATLILVYILNKIFSPGFWDLEQTVQTAWLIMLGGSCISSFTSIMVVLPRLRIFSRKQRIKDDIFYYKNIRSFFSRETYVDYLKDLPIDNKRIGKAYANQVYSLSTYVIPYKFKLLKISGWVLTVSIILSVIFFSASLGA